MNVQGSVLPEGVLTGQRPTGSMQSAASRMLDVLSLRRDCYIAHTHVCRHPIHAQDSTEVLTDNNNCTMRKRKTDRKSEPTLSPKNEQTTTDKNNRKVMMIIFISLLLDLLAFTMILPLFPSLLDYYSKSEGNSTGVYATLLEGVRGFQKLTGAPDRFSSVLFGGALGSMFSFLQFLASPIVGSLSDTYGRKPTLLVCLVGIAVSHAMWCCAQTFSLFVLARFVGGLSKANVSLSMAVVTDASTDKTRARGMALVGLAFSVGFIVGPVAGAWFAKSAATLHSAYGLWGQRPAMFALGLSVANIILVLFCLPETLPKEKRAHALFPTLSRAVDFVSPWHLMKFSAVKNLTHSQADILSSIGLIYFLYLFFYSGLEFTLTFLTHHTFGYTALQQGKMFLVIGVVMAALQGGAARRLNARGAVSAARGALLLTPLSFLSVAQAARQQPPLLSPVAWLWTGLVLFAISTAFAVSCMTSLAAGRAPEESRGAVLGCLRSLGALARAAGPLLASAVYWCSGATITYTMGGTILVLPAIMLYRLKT